MTTVTPIVEYHEAPEPPVSHDEFVQGMQRIVDEVMFEHGHTLMNGRALRDIKLALTRWMCSVAAVFHAPDPRRTVLFDLELHDGGRLHVEFLDLRRPKSTRSRKPRDRFEAVKDTAELYNLVSGRR